MILAIMFSIIFTCALISIVSLVGLNNDFSILGILCSGIIVILILFVIGLFTGELMFIGEQAENLYIP